MREARREWWIPVKYFLVVKCVCELHVDHVTTYKRLDA